MLLLLMLALDLINSFSKERSGTVSVLKCLFFTFTTLYIVVIINKTQDYF